MRLMRRHDRREKGFTLLELLIVVGIIAILVSVLMPMVGMLRARARGADCANNERQIYAALLAFVADHDGYLPVPAQVPDIASGSGRFCAWAINNNYGASGGGVLDFKVGTLWPYMGATVAGRQAAVLCPADAGSPSYYNNFTYNRNFSYSFNANIGHPTSSVISMKLTDVKLPASKLLIYEEEAPNDEWCLGGTNSADYPTGRHGTARATVKSGGPTNQLWMVEGLGNHCFFDGHVQQFSPQTIMTDSVKPISMWKPLK